MNARFALAALAVTLAASPAAAREPDPAALDQLIADRTAGEPVQCIGINQIRSTTIINGTAIVYRVGSALYVNRPSSGADQLDRDDIMVDVNDVGRLCAGGQVRMRDSGSGMYRSTIILGEFVPYRRGN